MMVARYSKSKSTAFVFVAVLAMVYVAIFPFFRPGGLAGYLKSGGVWASFYPFIFLLCLISLFFSVKFSARVVSNGWAAIRVASGVAELISARTAKMDVLEIEVVKLEMGGFFPFRFTYLVVVLKDGQVRKLSTSLFEEAADEACRRFQTALNQTR